MWGKYRSFLYAYRKELKTVFGLTISFFIFLLLIQIVASAPVFPPDSIRDLSVSDINFNVEKDSTRELWSAIGWVEIKNNGDSPSEEFIATIETGEDSFKVLIPEIPRGESLPVPFLFDYTTSGGKDIVITVEDYEVKRRGLRIK